MINRSFSYTGPDALETVNHYNADIAFVSCRGVSKEGLVTDNSIEENEVRRAMLKRAKQRFLLCDGQKLGKTCLHNLGSLSDFDDVICDIALPKELSEQLKKNRY